MGENTDDPRPIGVKQAVWILSAVGVPILSLIVGVFFELRDLERQFTTSANAQAVQMAGIETRLDSIADDQAELRRSAAETAAHLRQHLIDPSIHHAKLTELQGRINGLEQENDDLRARVSDLENQ